MLRASETIREVFAKSPVPVQILGKRKFDPTTLWTFLRLIKKEHIQVMHLHCYAASTFGRLAGAITGVPTVIHDYDTEVYFPYPWYLGIADRALAPMTRRGLAASPMVRNFLIRNRKIDRAHIELMLHAIPMGKYSPVPHSRISALKKQLEVGETTRVVGTVTKLGPQRGNECLLRAAAKVLKAHEDTVFLLIYRPTYFHRLPSEKHVPATRAEATRRITELEALARELGIDKKIRFIEHADDTGELCAACDLVVAPFLSERFSSVNLLEAMAMGKPLIATDMGEQSEIIHEGVNGYLVEPNNVQQMADRILQVMTNRDELDRMSGHAREMATAYSVDAYVERLQQLYAELAAEGTKERENRL
jgi:glycosyltransferase involved in cell wall biosynthesis